MHMTVFNFNKATTGEDLQRQLLLRQQIRLFQQLAMILRHLSERVTWENLTLPERRAMQRELASLKKTTQATRHRLKTLGKSASRL